MNTEVLVEESWNFVVFEDSGRWVMTYIAGGVGMYDVSVELIDEEVAQIRDNRSTANVIADTMRTKRESYKEREIHPSVWPQKELEN